VAHIASADLLIYRGANPDGSDQAVLTRGRDAAKWLERTGPATGLSPATTDSTTDTAEGGGVTVARPRRWV
jgi:hypothetical protein